MFGFVFLSVTKVRPTTNDPNVRLTPNLDYIVHQIVPFLQCCLTQWNKIQYVSPDSQFYVDLQTPKADKPWDSFQGFRFVLGKSNQSKSKIK